MKIRFLDELEYIRNKLKINKDEICLIGSAVLAASDIRENHDLDLALYPETRDTVLELHKDFINVLPSGTVNFSGNVQALKNRYAKIGILDEELFDDRYSTFTGGYRIARIEVEIAQKLERDYEKDRRDLKKIDSSYFKLPGFNEELFECLKKKRKAIIWGAGANAKLAYYCYCARFDLMCYVDNNERLWGNDLNGLKVCSPEIIKDTNAVIIISSKQFSDEIKKEIYLRFGTKKVITFFMKEEYSILNL